MYSAKIKIAWVNKILKILGQYFSFVELYGPNKTKSFLLIDFFIDMSKYSGHHIKLGFILFIQTFPKLICK